MQQACASSGRNCRIIAGALQKSSLSQIKIQHPEARLAGILNSAGLLENGMFQVARQEAGIVITNKLLVACIALILSAVALVSCARPPSEGEMGAEIGREAPKFKLPDLSGREISLDQYKGKIVMLDFWATWCGPCRTTMPLVENLQKEYPNDVVLLAVNLQEPKNIVLDYVRRQNIASEVLLDESGAVGEAYGVVSIPMQVLLDKRGIVRHAQIGFSARQLRMQIEKLK